MADPNEEETEELKKLLMDGKELKAIKRYREITGEGYQEAKDWFKQLKEDNPEDFPSLLGGCAPVIALLCLAGAGAGMYFGVLR